MAGARARRYAQAVFELAEADGDYRAWRERIRRVRDVLDREDVGAVLRNPAMPPTERVRLVETLLGEGLDQEALNLARLLVAAGAPELIDGIEEAYGEAVDQAEGRLRARAVAAVELPAGERERIARDLSAKLGKEVELEVRTDPGVIGGMLFEIGDRVIDATVAGRLQQLKRALAAS